jgi:hypothetical protein
MGLEDIYSNNVKKTSINQTGISTGIPSIRERDPQQVKLEQDVFAKMQEVASPSIPKEQNVQQVQNVTNVGLEQALKELLNSTESIDDKS